MLLVRTAQVETDHMGAEWGWRESWQRAIYKVQQNMLSTPFYKFLTMIVSTFACVVIGAIILKSFEVAFGAEKVDSWTSALGLSYTLVANAPEEATGADAFAHLISRNIIFWFGVLTFSVVLGIMTSTIEQQVDYLMDANYRVMEKDHTVILNWSQRTVPILRQIAKTRGYKALPVVIMANKDCEEMREMVSEGLGDLKLNVQVRSGEAPCLADLEKVKTPNQKMMLRPMMCAIPSASVASSGAFATSVYERPKALAHESTLSAPNANSKDLRMIAPMTLWLATGFPRSSPTSLLPETVVRRASSISRGFHGWRARRLRSCLPSSLTLSFWAG